MPFGIGPRGSLRDPWLLVPRGGELHEPCLGQAPERRLEEPDELLDLASRGQREQRVVLAVIALDPHRAPAAAAEAVLRDRREPTRRRLLGHLDRGAHDEVGDRWEHEVEEEVKVVGLEAIGTDVPARHLAVVRRALQLELLSNPSDRVLEELQVVPRKMVESQDRVRILRRDRF